MQPLYPRCAGLDVHKDSVFACVRHLVGRLEGLGFQVNLADRPADEAA